MGTPELNGKKSKKSDLLFLFEELYRRGKITKEEFDKCSRKVMGGNY